MFREFKALADKKQAIEDEDLAVLVGDELHQPTVVWQIEDLQVGADPRRGMVALCRKSSHRACNSPVESYHGRSNWL